MKLEYISSGLILNQKIFTKELVLDCGFDLFVKASTHLPLHRNLTSTDGDHVSDPVCTGLW